MFYFSLVSFRSCLTTGDLRWHDGSKWGPDQHHDREPGSPAQRPKTKQKKSTFKKMQHDTDQNPFRTCPNLLFKNKNQAAATQKTIPFSKPWFIRPSSCVSTGAEEDMVPHRKPQGRCQPFPQLEPRVAVDHFSHGTLVYQWLTTLIFLEFFILFVTHTKNVSKEENGSFPRVSHSEQFPHYSITKPKNELWTSNKPLSISHSKIIRKPNKLAKVNSGFCSQKNCPLRP